MVPYNSARRVDEVGTEGPALVMIVMRCKNKKVHGTVYSTQRQSESPQTTAHRRRARDIPYPSIHAQTLAIDTRHTNETHSHTHRRTRRTHNIPEPEAQYGTPTDTVPDAPTDTCRQIRRRTFRSDTRAVHLHPARLAGLQRRPRACWLPQVSKGATLGRRAP
jgi:hypothetical protein